MNKRYWLTFKIHYYIFNKIVGLSKSKSLRYAIEMAKKDEGDFNPKNKCKTTAGKVHIIGELADHGVFGSTKDYFWVMERL